MEADDPELLRRIVSRRQSPRLLLASRMLAIAPLIGLALFGLFIVIVLVSVLTGGTRVHEVLITIVLAGWIPTGLSWLAGAWMVARASPLHSWAARKGLPWSAAITLAIAVAYFAAAPWSDAFKRVIGGFFSASFAATVLSLVLVCQDLWSRTRRARYGRGGRIRTPSSGFAWLKWAVPAWAILSIAGNIRGGNLTPDVVRGLDSLLLLFVILPIGVSELIRFNRDLRDELSAAESHGGRAPGGSASPSPASGSGFAD